MRMKVRVVLPIVPWYSAGAQYMGAHEIYQKYTVTFGGGLDDVAGLFARSTGAGLIIGFAVWLSSVEVPDAVVVSSVTHGFAAALAGARCNAATL